MKYLAHYLLTASNLLGIPALLKADFPYNVLVGSIMLGSTLMHISETKHNLEPPILKNYSYALLNVDRALALSAGAVFAWKFFQMEKNVQLQVLIIGGIGAICMLLGEIKTEDKTFNNVLYPLLHTIWHSSVYACAYLLV